VLLGVFTSVLMEIIGVPALAFAVGMYLPLESTTPVFLGGLARKLVDMRRGSEAESDAGPGVLYSSGLVAGGSIMGLLTSFLGWPDVRVERVANAIGAAGTKFQDVVGHGAAAAVGFALFLGVAYLIYHTALTQRGAPAPDAPPTPPVNR
jgi:hypothetical protein